MRLLVIGASQGIGLATCKAALAAGMTVRAFSRGAEGMKLDDPNLEKMAGDALNVEDLTAALKDVDAVAHTLGVPLTYQTIVNGTDLFSSATAALLPLMAEHGPNRLVVVTGFGAGRCVSGISLLEKLPFRVVLGRIYDDKSKQEALVTDSGLDWTIIRPGVLTNGAARGKYKVLSEPNTWRNGMISRADVADYVVRALQDPATIGTDPVTVN
ncbi:MAG: NAD(P)-binding oxidoreductase [Pseudomonadota bacterium]